MADAYWSNVVLLLHCDGAQDSTTFTDKSCAALAVAAISPGRIDNTTKEYGTGSLIVDGTGGAIYVYAASKSKELTTNFCIELSAYVNTFDATRGRLFSNSGLKVRITDAQKLQLYSLDADFEDYSEHTGSTTLSAETWYKVAVSWDGTTLRAYLNGALEISTTDFAPDDSGWYIGGTDAGVGVVYIDEIRVTREEARYTSSSYSVATAAWEDESCGSSIVEAVAAADTAVTAAAIGRSLPYGEAACAVTAAAVGASTHAAAAAAAITATAAAFGGALPDLGPLPITIDVKLRVEVGLPIVIDVWVAKTATLPISLGRYAVTPTLPITIDAWVAKAPTLPITIYGDLSDSASDALVIWQPKVVLDGTTISGLLIQAQDVEFEEDASPIASLSFVPAAGAVDPLAWVGKTIALWWQRLVNGAVTNEILVYTGTVSDPEWDAVNRVLAISATGDMQAKFDRMTKAEIKATIGGTYSEYIFGDPDDMSGWDFAQALMSTQASTLWQDQSAAIRVTACAAKASADYTWTEDDLLEGTPVVRYAGRQDISNTIYLSLGYRYAALRQRNVVFNFRPYQLETPSTFLSGNLGGWELPQRSQIESAATGGGWVVIGSISYSDVWPNGLYSSYSDGGTPILEGLSITPEVAADLCIGARWTAARRWKQSWTEQYALTVQASDSVAAVGTLATDESYAIEDPADDEEWESNEEFTGYKAGSTTMPNGLDRVYRLDTIRADVTAAQSVALAKAQAEILKSHRRTTVEVTLPFQPQLSLADTVAIDTTYLECKGKVRRIRHHWDIETGDCTTEVSIALSRHNGSGLVAGDALTPPSEPGDPDETEPDTYHNLEMHIGGQDNLPEWDEDWDGFVVNVPYSSSYGENTLRGSWSRNPANPALANRIYEEGFHVLPPTIDSEYADPLDFTDAMIYDVAIPQDLLVLVSG